jgi:uncharacterized damage-inducible protein DinB
MATESTLRKQLSEFITGGHAHATFDQAVGDFPLDQIGKRPPKFPHSAWELVEHIRITQNDVLCFSQSADYKSPKWPEGYWPKSPAPAKPEDWHESILLYHEDRQAFQTLVQDPAQDLYTPFPWGDGQTLLREALLIIDHTAYHVGQLLLVRRALGAWPG